jgi:hypothetical protein
MKIRESFSFNQVADWWTKKETPSVSRINLLLIDSIVVLGNYPGKFKARLRQSHSLVNLGIGRTIENYDY